MDGIVLHVSHHLASRLKPKSLLELNEIYDFNALLYTFVFRFEHSGIRFGVLLEVRCTFKSFFFVGALCSLQLFVSGFYGAL